MEFLINNLRLYEIRRTSRYIYCRCAFDLWNKYHKQPIVTTFAFSVDSPTIWSAYLFVKLHQVNRVREYISQIESKIIDYINDNDMYTDTFFIPMTLYVRNEYELSLFDVQNEN